VARLRRSSGERHVGHGGTLDPLATGVLPVYFGRAARLAGEVAEHRKCYIAEVRLGAGSDTDDADGNVRPAVLPPDISAKRVTEALAAFAGEIDQQPPAYSAVHVEGQRSHRRARAHARHGRVPESPPARRVVAHHIELLEFRRETDAACVRLEVECAPGFYVRSLARDLGRALGTEGYVAALQRRKDGPLVIEDAIALADAESLGPDIARLLLQPSRMLHGLPSVSVPERHVKDLEQGRAVPAAGHADGAAWARGSRDRVLALGDVRNSWFLPHRLVEI